MSAWVEAAVRGNFDLDVVTKAKAIEDAQPLPDGVQYLGIAYPTDGRPMFLIGWRDFALLAGFLREMKPHDLRLLHARTEDGAALLSALVQFADSADMVVQ